MSIKENKLFINSSFYTLMVTIFAIPLGTYYFLALYELPRRQTVSLVTVIAITAIPLMLAEFLLTYISVSPIAELLEKISGNREISGRDCIRAERRGLLFPYLDICYAILLFSSGGLIVSWVMVTWFGLGKEFAVYFIASAVTTGVVAGLATFFLVKKPLREAFKIVLEKCGSSSEKPPIMIPIAYKLAGMILILVALILVFLALLSFVSFKRILENEREGLQARGLVALKSVLESSGADPETAVSTVQGTSGNLGLYCLADKNFILKSCPAGGPNQQTLEILAAAPEAQAIRSKSSGWTWVWCAMSGDMIIISGWEPQKTTQLLATVRSYYIKVALMALLITAGIVILMALDLSRPIRELARTAVDISEGKSVTSINQGNDDETGILARAFNRMTGVLLAQFRNELDRSKNILENVRSAVNTLEPMATQLMSTTVDQVSGSHEQSAAVQEVATTSREMAATSMRIAARSEEVSATAGQTAATSLKGKEFMGKVISGMDQIKERVENVSSRILQLGEQSRQISGVINIINEISEQTNLLALNASIEAAGAGEAGRRFSVVAGEVRRLAGNTLDSTNMVRQRIESIQRLTHQIVMLSEEEMKTVESGAKLVGEMGDYFGRILEMVDNTSQAATEIKSSTQQQSTASEQMASTLVEITTVVSESEKNVKEIENAVNALKKIVQELSGLIN
jgi:methyl-accepting chemotaxis protein